MTDLDPKVMAIFTKEYCADAKEATQVIYTFNIHAKFIYLFTLI